MTESRYNTNLAAEYYVLSVLYRRGLNAYLTLGSKKAIDIVVNFGDHLSTIDVKGIAGTTLWPMDNFKGKKPNHFVVLVSFLNKITDARVLPETYVLPSSVIRPPLLYRNPARTRSGITRASVTARKREFLGRWDLIK